MRKMILIGKLLIFGSFLFLAQSNSWAVTQKKTVTCTCDGCCSNGKSTSETDNYESTDGGVSWTIASYSVTGCDGVTHTYTNGVMRTVGTLPQATAVTFTCNGHSTNISPGTGNASVTEYDGAWNISGY